MWIFVFANQRNTPETHTNLKVNHLSKEFELPFTLQKFKSSPLKSYLPKRRVVFHPSFSGAMLNFRGVPSIFPILRVKEDILQIDRVYIETKHTKWAPSSYRQNYNHYILDLPPPSNSGKWRFSSGFPTKNGSQSWWWRLHPGWGVDLNYI